MSSEVSTWVELLSKRHHAYEKPAHRLWQMLLGLRKQYFKDFPILDDIDFEIKKGETVDIIRRNGSGKSTSFQRQALADAGGLCCQRYCYRRQVP